MADTRRIRQRPDGQPGNAGGHQAGGGGPISATTTSICIGRHVRHAGEVVADALLQRTPDLLDVRARLERDVQLDADGAVIVRRMLTGMAMGGTAIALVFSPLGKRSGAHFNPAVTLTFWRLGK